MSLTQLPDSSGPAQPDDLPLYPPKRDMTRPFDPPSELLAWQRDQPVREVRLWDGSKAWVITRHEDVQSALRNEEAFSADPRRPGFTEKSAAYSAVMGTDRNLRTMDNPEHGQQKRMLVRDFTVKSIGQLEPVIRNMINQLLDEMLAKGPPADFYGDLAFLVPTWVICEMLGLPFDDRHFFADRATQCTSHVVSFETAATAGKELADYIDRMLESKLTDPKDDLLTRLAGEMQAGRIEREDLVGLARFLLIAGHETTANTMALSTLALLQNPDQLQDLRTNLDNPAFMANAIEEMLRYLSVAHTGRRRVTIKDVEIGGVTIPAEQPVIMANNLADRDESVFPNADRLDLRRPNARATLVFGYGVHQCLGQLLTRRELALYHDILWRRVPDLRLAVPFSEIEFDETRPVYAVEALPVTWS